MAKILKIRKKCTLSILQEIEFFLKKYSCVFFVNSIVSPEYRFRRIDKIKNLKIYIQRVYYLYFILSFDFVEGVVRISYNYYIFCKKKKVIYIYIFIFIYFIHNYYHSFDPHRYRTTTLFFNIFIFLLKKKKTCFSYLYIYYIYHKYRMPNSSSLFIIY